MKTKTTLLLLLFLFTSTIYSQSDTDPDNLGGPVYVGTIPALTVPSNDAKLMRSSTSRFKREAVNTTNLEWPNAGAVHIEKTAQATTFPDKWKINVMVEGKNIPKTTDVVLVIDDSGSMGSNSKMTTAKEAAKKFVNELLTNSTGIRVAIVTINSEKSSGVPQIDHAFTDDRPQLLNSINSISAAGGTNLQGGFYAARSLMDISVASKKVVILLSDGEPTYSYKSTPSINIDMNCENKSNFSIVRESFERDHLTVSASNYLNVTGNGSNFKFALYSKNITCGAEKYDIIAGNHGIPTAHEAALLINSGVDVYTIGFGVSAGGEAEKTLQKSQSKGYYPANTSNIQNIYSAIRSNISYAATNAILTDPMSGYIVLDANVVPSFSVLPIDTGDVVISKGTINFTQNGYVLNDPNVPSSGNSNLIKWKITWNIGTVSELGENMNYFVTLAPNTNPTLLYDANEQTYMDYTDVNGNTTANQKTPNNFTIPKVSGGKGSIEIIYYAVNSAGEPINSSGTVVNKENALKLIPGNSTYFKFNNETALTLNQSYSVNPDASYQSNNNSYQLFCSFGNTDSTPTATDPNKKVWFGYFIDTPPIASDQTECSDGTAIQKLTATATTTTGTIKWYLLETGGAVINDPVQIGVGTTTYYAEVSYGSCTTVKRTPVKLTINLAPVAVITSSKGLELNCTITSTTLTARGGTSYLWSNGETTPSITVTTADKFSVIVTNDNGCTATTCATTTLDTTVPLAVITNSNGLELNCTIPSTTLTASGGTSYLWSNGETTPSITVTTADKFSVIVTNENGCTATTCATTTLDTTVPVAVITSSNGLELNCTITSTTLTASGGTSYLWSNGETTPSITVTTPDKFAVIVTNDNGCTATTCATTTLDTTVPIAVITNSNGLELNCTIPSTTLTASGGTSYLWSNGETTSSITVTTADKFAVIVTNENGCTATTCATTTLDTTVPVAVITSSNGMELNCTITSTTLTAIGGTSYLWSNGETTPSITVTTADKFSVIVTNYNGCTATTCATTTLDTTVPVAVITSSNGLELNCTITSTTLTASGGTSYLWSNGETTPSITVTTADKFSVIVTNDNGCTATTCATTTLDTTVPVAVITSSNGLELNCTITSTTLTASGGTSYLWSNGETTPSITVTTADKFSVIVTNENGCTATTCATTTLDTTVPIAVITSSDGLELNCTIPSTILTVSGGTSYLWSNGETTPSITVTTADKFSVIVTNDNGCTATTCATTTLDTTVPIISLSSKVDIYCLDGNNGAITITSSENSGANSYAWTKNNIAYSTSKNLTELSAGIYTVIATSANGCSSEPFIVTISQPTTSLSATAVITNNINCIGCSKGAINLTVSGGNDGIYTYLWSNNETTKDISNLYKGDYSVAIKDSKGCTVNYNYTITESGISITKEGTYIDSNNDGITNIGDVVAYTFVVKNTGNETLINLTIIDDNAIVSNKAIDTLAAGETNSTTFTASHIITQKDIDAGIVYNLATVKSYDPKGNLITATSTDPTPCTNCPLTNECADCTTTDLNQNPSLKVIKNTLTSSFSKIGDILLYTIVVENTGNVTLHQIRVQDPLTGLDVTIEELQPGQKSKEYSQSYTVTQQDLINKSVTNIATAEGLSPSNTLINGSDTVTVNQSKMIIDAVDDSKDSVDATSGIKNVLNVLTNDRLNQIPVIQQNVTLNLVTADATGMLSLNPDGSVDVKQGTPAGTYTLTYQICEILNSANCDTATVTIKVIQNEVLKITGDACNADTSVTDLSNLLPSGTSTNGTWTDTEQSNALNGSLLSAFELEIRTYVFEYKIIEETGIKIFLISVQINDDCKVLPCGTVLVHNAFSPNGDGTNDYFAIDNIDETNCYAENNVEIYNRWGVLVFETKNYSNSSNYFDGTSRGRTTIKKGDGLPTGTYFYILNFTSVDGSGTTISNKKDGYLYLSK